MLGLFTLCVFSTVLKAFKVKSEEKYYVRVDFYNSTESELVASEEVSEDYVSRMEESNLWQLIGKLFETDSIVLGLLLAVFAGGAVLLTIINSPASARKPPPGSCQDAGISVSF